MPKFAYLDTFSVIWLAEGKLDKLSRAALDAVNEYDLLVSPFVGYELSLLREKKTVLRSASAILRQLKTQLGVEVCAHPLIDIAEVAASESWTRDPMDRMIVAHARANKYSPLVSSDRAIRANYPPTIW